MNYKIIYEDNDIIVCHKMAGLPVQTGKIGAQVEVPPQALIDLLGADTADIVV